MIHWYCCAFVLLLKIHVYFITLNMTTVFVCLFVCHSKFGMYTLMYCTITILTWNSFTMQRFDFSLSNQIDERDEMCAYSGLRTVPSWKSSVHVVSYHGKLNKATRKDHFPLPFIDQMLDRLAGYSYYCFLDGYSGYNQIAIAPAGVRWSWCCKYGLNVGEISAFLITSFHSQASPRLDEKKQRADVAQIVKHPLQSCLYTKRGSHVSCRL